MFLAKGGLGRFSRRTFRPGWVSRAGEFGARTEVSGGPGHAQPAKVQLRVGTSLAEAEAHRRLDPRGVQEPAGEQEGPRNPRPGDQPNQGRLLQSQPQGLPHQDNRRNIDFWIRKLP